jgi:hypothetical protein
MGIEQTNIDTNRNINTHQFTMDAMWLTLWGKGHGADLPFRS